LAPVTRITIVVDNATGKATMTIDPPFPHFHAIAVLAAMQQDLCRQGMQAAINASPNIIQNSGQNQGGATS
jgi:hypothetical protein